MDFLSIFILIASFGYGQGFMIARNYTDMSLVKGRHMDGRSFYGLGATTAAPAEADQPFDLIITGIADRDNGGDILELYVVRDILDLSEYALGVANNGDGTDGIEFTFNADSYTAGDFIYVNIGGSFDLSFFGVTENYTFDCCLWVSGNDAIELFQNGAVIDVFGEISINGDGTAFDYRLGWAYRVSGAHQTTTFNINDWSFSGTDVLIGLSSNTDSTTPFPLGTYSPY